MNDSTTQKSLFGFLDKICQKKQSLLPDGTADDIVTKFNDYSVQKITRIGTDLDGQARDLPTDVTEMDPVEHDHVLSEFKKVSPEQVDKIIKSASNATCALDPLPTWILKQCTQELLSTITQIVNLSLTSGEFPHSMKRALVKPLTKK